MILVLLGTQHNEFSRLLQKIEECILNGGIKEKVIVQAGFTKFSSNNMEIFDLIPLDELEKMVSEANFIITHGGVGSILTALNKNKKVIAVPRLSKFNEHVNDHQKQIVDIFNQKEYIIGIQEVDELPEALKKVENFMPKPYEKGNNKILNIVEDFINKC